MPRAAATRSTARLVGIERATPASPSRNHGTSRAFAASTARLSLGPITQLRPTTRLRSPSPSEAAPKSGASGRAISAISAAAWTALGSGCRPAKSGRGAALTALPEAALENLHRIGAGDRVHRIEAQAEAAAEQLAQPVEIENPLHQRGIVGDRV